MSLLHRFAAKNSRSKGGGKRIACTYRIGNGHSRSFLERYNSRSKHIAAVRAASKNKHFQIVFGKKNPALILQVYTRIAEYTADCHQFFIVYLQNVAAFERLAQYFFRVEVLTEVHKESLWYKIPDAG